MNERGVVITTALFSGIVLIIISALLFVGYFAVSTGTGSDATPGTNVSANRTGGVNPTTTITPLTNNRTTPPFVGGGGGGGSSSGGSSGGGSSSSSSSGGGNQAPTAVISATPFSGAAPLTVTFNGSGSSDPEGQALTYLWSWNNGTSNLTHTNVSFSTVFVNPENYTVSLRVTDSAGAASTITSIIIMVCSGTCNQTIDSTAPTVSLSPSQPGNNIVVSNPVLSSNYFLASVTDNLGLANATFYLWDATTHQLILQREAPLSGTSIPIRFPVSPSTFTLPAVGSYRWNILARDAANNAAFATNNFTLTYTPIPNSSATLSVTLSGTGSGTVTSSPLGINCGAICSANFSQNQTVTLSASATNGSIFAGWNGAGCSGTGICNVVMSSNQSVNAMFNLIPSIQGLSFVPPTPADGAVLSSTDIPVNVSSQGNNHYTFVDFNRDVRLWLTMDSTNASGSPLDVSTWNNQISLKQGANIDAGLFGNALSLKSGSQKPYLRVADSANLRLNSTGHMTISAWIKRDSEYGYSNAGGADNSTSPWTTIVNKVDINTLNGWELSLFHNRTEVIFRRNGATAFDMMSAPIITNGAWIHVAFSYDGSSVTQYVNGVQVAYGLAPTVWGDSSEPLYVGARSVDGAPWQAIMFNGSIDEVIVFDRAFSGSEIQALYNVTSAVYHNYANLTQGAYSFTAYDRNSTAISSLIRSVTLSTGGGGSVSVCTVQDLNTVRNNLAGDYVQTCDINLNAVEWLPIGSSTDGSSSQPFTGSYNGNGYSISGLVITPSGTLTNPAAEKGLFARVQNAQLSTITLNGGNIVAEAGSVGGIAGSSFNSSFDQMQINGLTIAPDQGLSQGSPSYVGGVVGMAGDSSITNSWIGTSSLVGVTVGGIAGSIYGFRGTMIDTSTVVGSVFQGLEVGGIVGSALSVPAAQHHSLSNLQLNATIFCDDFGFASVSCSAGGLAGTVAMTRISEAYVRGDVLDVSTRGGVGGLIGLMSQGPSTIDMAHTRVHVAGNGKLGGFIGFAESPSSTISITDSSARGSVFFNETGSSLVDNGGAGGFIGDLGSNVAIANSYASDTVRGHMYVGGFIGKVSGSNSQITDSYARGDVQGFGYVAGFVGDAGMLSLTRAYSAGIINGTATELSGIPDGGLDINDFLYFNTQFESGSLEADLDDGSGTGTPDGGLDINDFLYFNTQFESGLIGADLTGGGLPGGFAAKPSQVGSFTSCYWNQEKAGIFFSPECTSKTTAEMATQATFIGWDFVTVWNMLLGNSPQLAWEPSVLFSPSEGNFVQRNFATIMLVHGILFVLLLIALVFYYYRGRKSSLGSVSPAPSMTPSRPSPPSSPSAKPVTPVSKPAPSLPPRPVMPAGPLNFRRPVQFGNNRPSTTKK